jgi:hypothetical protein
MPKETAIKAVGIILSCYPSANREGIDNYYKMASESLSEFPDQVLQRLCDPKTGIVTSHTFLPSIHEMRNFCNKEWDRITPRRVEDREEEIKQISGSVDVETLAEREARRAVVKAKFQELIKELSLGSLSNSMRKRC